jgi:hypothetical protein
MKGPKIFGHVELNSEGMNLVNTRSPGPYKIIDMDHQFGVEIMDNRNIAHWIMKGNYNILDFNSVQMPETQQKKVDNIVKLNLQQFAPTLLDNKLKIVKELVEIQGQRGNWDMDDYMCGMYNGMELILATLEEREPEYKTLKKVTDDGCEKCSESDPAPKRDDHDQ